MKDNILEKLINNKEALSKLLKKFDELMIKFDGEKAKFGNVTYILTAGEDKALKLDKSVGREATVAIYLDYRLCKFCILLANRDANRKFILDDKSGEIHMIEETEDYGHMITITKMRQYLKACQMGLINEVKNKKYLELNSTKKKTKGNKVNNLLDDYYNNIQSLYGYQFDYKNYTFILPDDDESSKVKVIKNGIESYTDLMLDCITGELSIIRKMGSDIYQIDINQDKTNSPHRIGTVKGLISLANVMTMKQQRN